MLWFKAWLEVRWRFVFLVGSVLLIWLSPWWITATGVHSGVPATRLWMAIQLGSVLMFIFTAIFLAGSGINTQGMYTFTPGFHALYPITPNFAAKATFCAGGTGRASHVHPGHRHERLHSVLAS
jgi:hypothetical protein